MNSETCFSNFDESIYRVQFTPAAAHMRYLNNTFTKKKKKKKDKNKYKKKKIKKKNYNKTIQNYTKRHKTIKKNN